MTVLPHIHEARAEVSKLLREHPELDLKRLYLALDRAELAVRAAVPAADEAAST